MGRLRGKCRIGTGCNGRVFVGYSAGKYLGIIFLMYFVCLFGLSYIIVLFCLHLLIVSKSLPLLHDKVLFPMCIVLIKRSIRVHILSASNLVILTSELPSVRCVILDIEYNTQIFHSKHAERKRSIYLLHLSCRQFIGRDVGIDNIPRPPHIMQNPK